MVNEKRHIIFKHDDYGELHFEVAGVQLPKSIQTGLKNLDEIRFNCPNWTTETNIRAAIENYPLFFEWQKIDFLFVSLPYPFHKTPYTFYVNGLPLFVSKEIAGQHHLNGSFKLENAVGFTDFVIKDDRDMEIFRLETEVFPQKLDYKQDFHAMISDITEIVYNLVFDYLKQTYAFAKPRDVANTSLIEWQAILQVLFTSLDRSIDLILRNPKSNIHQDNRVRDIARIKKADKKVRKWILKNQRFCSKDGYGFRVAPQVNISRLPECKKTITYNTFENRLVVWAIRQILSRVEELKRFIKKLPSRKEALTAALNALANYEHRLRKRLNDACFAQVDEFENQWHFSTVMTMAPGYRDFYHRFLLLRKGLSVFSDDFFKIDYKDIATVYEYWCFLKIVKTLKENPKYNLESSDLIKVSGRKFIINLKQGKTSKLLFKDKTTKEPLALYYNRSFPFPKFSKTFSQKPDYAIQFKKNGYDNPFWYVLDAKYRFDKYDEVGTNKFSPPQDAISQLHRYRDAILYDIGNKENIKETISYRTAIKSLGGVILYPYPGEENDFRNNKYFQSLSDINIGAIPLIPQKDQLFKKFLNDLFLTSPESHYEQFVAFDKSDYQQFSDELRSVVVIGMIKEKEYSKRYNFYLKKRLYNIQFIKDLETAVYKAKYLALYSQKEKRIIGYATIKNIQIIDNKELQDKGATWKLNSKRYILYEFSNFIECQIPSLHGFTLPRGYRYSNYFAFKTYLETGAENALVLNDFNSIRLWQELRARKVLFNVTRKNSYRNKQGIDITALDFKIGKLSISTDAKLEDGFYFLGNQKCTLRQVILQLEKENHAK